MLRYMNRATCPSCRGTNTRRVSGPEQTRVGQDRRSIWVCQVDHCGARFAIPLVSMIPRGADDTSAHRDRTGDAIPDPPIEHPPAQTDKRTDGT